VVLNKSESLKGYAYLIEQIRIYMNQGLSRDKAIQAAIKYCIETNVLAKFLRAIPLSGIKWIIATSSFEVTAIAEASALVLEKSPWSNEFRDLGRL